MDFLEDDSDLEELEQKQDRASLLKSVLSGVGGIMQNQANVPSAYEYMYDKKMPRSDFQGTMDRAASGIEDPMARKQKAMEYMKQKRSALSAQNEDSPDSPDSLAYQQQISTLFPKLKNVVVGKSKTQIETMMPLLTAKIKGDVDRETALIGRQDRVNETKRKESLLDDKQVAAITDMENAEGDLNNIMSQLGEKTEWTGPVDGNLPDMTVGNDQVAWRSAIGKYKDAYRKAITGSGASAAEVAKLESRLPTETDTHANFKAKANEAIKELARRKGITLGNYQKMGKDVSKFGSGDKAVVKQERNKKTGELRITYSDGTQEIKPSTAGR